MTTNGRKQAKSRPRTGKAASDDGARMAFSRPGGENLPPARPRPLDMEHLARQTMGDRALEQEVLALFAHHIGTILHSIQLADTAERLRLAHTLKGAARSVGAFALADCAERLEADPGDKAILSRLARRICEVSDFVAAISR